MAKSGMTANWITAHGFTARSVTPQGRYAGYSGHHGFTPRRHAELVSASSRYDNNRTLKPFNQTPYYNFTGRGQMVKAAVQGDGKISIGAPTWPMVARKNSFALQPKTNHYNPPR